MEAPPYYQGEVVRLDAMPDQPGFVKVTAAIRNGPAYLVVQFTVSEGGVDLGDGVTWNAEVHR